MPRDLMNPLLAIEPEPQADDLEEQDTRQLLNPTGFGPLAALVGDNEEAA